MKPSHKQLSLLARQSLLDIPDNKVGFFLLQNSYIC